MQNYDDTKEHEEFIYHLVLEVDSIDDQIKRLQERKAEIEQKVADSLDYHSEKEKPFEAGDLKFTVKKNKYYKVNASLYEVTKGCIPDFLDPVRANTTYTVDKSALKRLKEDKDHDFTEIFNCIEEREGKVTVKVKDFKDE